MRAFVIGLLLGTMALQNSDVLPSESPWLPLLAALAASLVGLLLPRHTTLLHAGAVASWLLAGLLTGWSYAHYRAYERLQHELPQQWEGQDIDVIAVVASLPTLSERGTRFLADIESVATLHATIPPRVSLTWYTETDRKRNVKTPPPTLVPGDRWQLTIRLRRPHGTSNPHGFDFEAWALERNIRATGYVRPKGVNQQVHPASRALSYEIDRTRLSIRDRMQQALREQPYAGVLVALAIGDQNAIPEDQWKVFWRTGTGHLMSISGLHITMMAALAYWLVSLAWSRINVLVRHIPAQVAAAACGAIAALAYSLIAGFSVPTQRTFFMLAAVALALCWRRSLSSSRILALALCVVLLIDPWSVLAPGFWLSFGAVAVIFHATGKRSGRTGVLSTAARVQLAVTMGLFPMMLALFQEVSLVAPLANAFAIPIVSWVVVPMTLTGAFLSADWLLWLAHAVMALTDMLLTMLANVPHSVWQSHAPVAWTVVLAIAGIALWLLPRGTPWRWGGAIAVLPMFVVLPPAPQTGELWITLLDVGQGLATVVRTANHSLVYDAGPKWAPDLDAGGRIVVPFLRSQGVRNLDALVITHDDEDHTGGARTVIDARRPTWVLTSIDTDRDILTNAVETIRCAAGQYWHWDGIDFQVLHPTVDSYAESRKTNNLGCVIKITSPGGSVLMTADIEKQSEAELLRREAPHLASEVLIVPHHGSKTSSSPAFLDAISPRLALIPVGYRNRFRHPHPDVLIRYAERSIIVFRTDLEGAITLRLPVHRQQADIEIVRHRQRTRRYWTDLPRDAQTEE